MRKHSCEHSRPSILAWSGRLHPHDLPANAKIGVEEPFEARGSGCVIVATYWFLSKMQCTENGAPINLHTNSSCGKMPFGCYCRQAGSFSKTTRLMAGER